MYYEFCNSGYQLQAERICGGSDDDDDDDTESCSSLSRKSKLLIIGSTVFGTTGKNLFLNQETRKYSPCLRLNIALRPGGKGEKMLNHLLVRKVALLMDALVYKHNPELKDESDCAKVIIPEKYRICGTCFTAFTLVGDFSDG